MKKCIAVAAFTAIFLSALFLFMRNYPSDRLFSVVFILAGGVSLWGVCGVDAAEAEAEAEVGVATAAECTETTTAAETAADTAAETRTDNEVSESYAQNTNKN
jgi:hypothetical protein